MSPPDREVLGTFLSAGKVNVASQAGKQLVTNGWDINQPLLGSIVEYIEINNELKILTANASSDGAGNSTLTFAPAIRKSPADLSDVITTNPKLTARIVGDSLIRALQAHIIDALSIE